MRAITVREGDEVAALVGTMLFHIFFEGKARMALQTALEGALARLSQPRCEQVFDDFVDAEGRPLRERLQAAGQSGAQHLSMLYFVEADERRCEADELMLAFTQPGSRVVHMCAARFAGRFSLKLRDGELLLIHELLHTLGLGENPPSRAQISRVVRSRCG